MRRNPTASLRAPYPPPVVTGREILEMPLVGCGPIDTRRVETRARRRQSVSIAAAFKRWTARIATLDTTARHLPWAPMPGTVAPLDPSQGCCARR